MKATKQSALIHQRWLIRRDMPEVLDIESYSDCAWNEEVFLHHLRQRNIIGMVAEYSETVVGFMVYALEKDCLALLNFAVHPEWRRLGVGRQMIARIVAKMSSGRRNRITANVHEGNLPMQLFLRETGFRAVRIDGEFYRFVRRLESEAAKRVAELMGE